LILATATQDIAVDGWSVQLLSNDNVSYSSTCQAIGQNIGFFLSYSVFLALNDPSFSNYIRGISDDEMNKSDAGIITINGYMWFWGILYILCTVYLFLFKEEKSQYTALKSISPIPQIKEEQGEVNHDDENDTHHHHHHALLSTSSITLSRLIDSAIIDELKSTYMRMWRTIQLPAIRQLIFVLLTSKIAFAASDNLTVLKLVEHGFPKEKMAMMAFLLFPFELIYPLIVGRWQKMAKQPLEPFLYGYPFRQSITLLGVLLVYSIPLSTSGAAVTFTWWFYLRVFILQVIYSFASNLMFVSQCGFFAEICDLEFGGSYMTLLNTVSNLGSAWPKPIVLTLTDLLTCTTTTTNTSTSTSTSDGSTEKSLPVTSTSTSSWACSLGISVGTDGYYILSIACFVFGIVWYAMYLRHAVNRIGRMSRDRFTISQ